MFGNSNSVLTSKDQYAKYQYHLLSKDHEEQMDEQNEKLDLISSRVASLKNISQTLHNELSDQAVLLDEVGNEMDRVDSKMNTIMIKLRKILRLSDDKRQWTLIGVLLVAILIIIVLFNVLP